MRAAAFDPARLETRGSHVTALSGVGRNSTGVAQAAIAGDGTLAYVLGEGVGMPSMRTLAWVDRQGRETPITAPGRRYVYPRLSPDGSRIAVTTVGEETDVWIWNLERRTFTPATPEPGTDHSPLWTPDGLQLIFSSERVGIRNLFSRRVDTPDAAEQLTESSNRQHASGVSRDGKRVIFTETSAKTGDDVMQLEMDGSRRVTPLIHSGFAERNGVISPDGRWLAYESNASGRFEVSVRPFPDVKRGDWPVSTGGGTRPLWTPNGQELVYVAPSGALMVSHGQGRRTS